MKNLLISVIGVGSLVASVAIADQFIAKSGVKGDVCQITATTSDTGTAFKISSNDGDRVDIHCKNVVVKVSAPVTGFTIDGMTAKDLDGCIVHEHGKPAGMVGENAIKTKAKFSKVSS